MTVVTEGEKQNIHNMHNFVVDLTFKSVCEFLTLNQIKDYQLEKSYKMSKPETATHFENPRQVDFYVTVKRKG